MSGDSKDNSFSRYLMPKLSLYNSSGTIEPIAGRYKGGSYLSQGY